MTCETEHYREVRAGYGVLGLLWLVLGYPHYMLRTAVQAEAIGSREPLRARIRLTDAVAGYRRPGRADTCAQTKGTGDGWHRKRWPDSPRGRLPGSRAD